MSNKKVWLHGGVIVLLIVLGAFIENNYLGNLYVELLGFYFAYFIGLCMANRTKSDDK